MSEKQIDSNQELSFAELKEIATILKSAPDLRTFSLKFRNLELSIESGLGRAEPWPGPYAAPNSSDSLGSVPQSDAKAQAEGNSPGEDSAQMNSAFEDRSREHIDTAHYVVTSPMVGTYYKASQPGAKPFVSLGDKVKKGDVVCLIEVMKLINSVITEVDGVVVGLHVEDAEAVAHGQPLISIKPD
jgi:acetyl-CoA carboxylase biotin carboxyl carrier protein